VQLTKNAVGQLLFACPLKVFARVFQTVAILKKKKTINNTKRVVFYFWALTKAKLASGFNYLF